MAPGIGSRTLSLDFVFFFHVLVSAHTKSRR